MRVDDLVDLGHEADRLTQDGDDLLKVINVIFGQGAARLHTVIQPIVANVMAGEEEFLYIYWLAVQNIGTSKLNVLSRVPIRQQTPPGASERRGAGPVD